MVEISDIVLPSNVYEEDISNESTVDMASKGLQELPKMDSKILCVSFLFVFLFK